jgi:hypothetical protein
MKDFHVDFEQFESFPPDIYTPANKVNVNSSYLNNMTSFIHISATQIMKYDLSINCWKRTT